MRTWVLGLSLAVPGGCACAQTLGSVSAADAAVTQSGAGVAPVSARIPVAAGSVVTAAKDHAAQVALARGGEIEVCQSTGLHVAGTGAGLLLGLDRGAMEFRGKAGADVVVTPDLRLAAMGGGSFDLRMRVSPDGDTCVENRGKKAPALDVTDAFGEARYLVKPGQHVMFEHGSLKAVDDRETTPCGCPPPDVRAVPLAEALLHGGQGSMPPQQAAAPNPFPAAVSEGLAEPAPLPAETPGGVKVQVADTLTFDPAKAAPAPIAASAPSAAEPPKAGPLQAVGRFFKRLFVR